MRPTTECAGCAILIDTLDYPFALPACLLQNGLGTPGSSFQELCTSFATLVCRLTQVEVTKSLPNTGGLPAYAGSTVVPWSTMTFVLQLGKRLPAEDRQLQRDQYTFTNEASTPPAVP